MGIHLTPIMPIWQSFFVIDYPKNIMELEHEFDTEKKCRDYIIKLKFEDGKYTCPLCGSKKSWLVRENSFECADCHHQESILSGTIFQDTHKPLTLWFRAIWYITSQKNGTSALGLQKVLGIGSYKTAWTWLHKLRRAMVRPDRDKLKGKVEVDEAFFGAPETGGKRGRGGENKVQAAIAVETTGGKVGRIRIKIIDDASQESLHDFIKETIEPGSLVVTDGWRGYNGLTENGYKHEIIEHETKELLLPHVHTVISLIKRWILGTLQGSCSKEHLPYYFDEYTFRFNRRKSNSRGMLFYRLMQNAVHLEPVTYKKIIAK
jgi:transposase-like protein